VIGTRRSNMYSSLVLPNKQSTGDGVGPSGGVGVRVGVGLGRAGAGVGLGWVGDGRVGVGPIGGLVGIEKSGLPRSKRSASSSTCAAAAACSQISPIAGSAAFDFLPDYTIRSPGDSNRFRSLNNPFSISSVA
jgi:hypothetical protein